MSEIFLGTFYIWVFLANSECVLPADFVKYTSSYFHSHCTRNCNFCYFLEIVEILKFCDEKLFKIFLYLCNHFVRKMDYLVLGETVITPESFVVESYPSHLTIALSVLYLLVYNIPSHFNFIDLKYLVAENTKALSRVFTWLSHLPRCKAG